MAFRLLNAKLENTRLWLAHLVAMASLSALIGAVDARARGIGGERSVESNQSRTAGKPTMAIISLHNQRITIYDANGWILRAPVSSGQGGVKRRSESSASFKKMLTTIRTCMTMPICLTCNASPGRASRSTVDPCQDIRRPMAASGYRSISQQPYSTQRDWGCG